jgi:hypothetical protein
MSGLSKLIKGFLGLFNSRFTDWLNDKADKIAIFIVIFIMIFSSLMIFKLASELNSNPPGVHYSKTNNNSSYDDNTHHVDPHYVEGYHRSDGTYVEGYWRGGDDGYYRSDPSY